MRTGIALIKQAEESGGSTATTLEQLPTHRLRYPHLLPAHLTARLSPYRPQRHDDPGDAPMARELDADMERVKWLVYLAAEQRAALPRVCSSCMLLQLTTHDRACAEAAARLLP